MDRSDRLFLEILRAIIGAGLPDDTKGEIAELARLSNRINRLANEPTHIPQELVDRFNELADKHFPEGKRHAENETG